MADIPEEHLTEELLDRLLASASIEQYLDEGLVSARTLTDYLFDRMEAHGLKRADVVRASGLNATVVYDIFSGKSRPGRDHAHYAGFWSQVHITRNPTAASSCRRFRTVVQTAT